MAYTSARLNLPLLQAGQAQKEFTHNEALTTIEAMVQPVAQTLGDNVPPSAPAVGQCWIVGTAPTGDWAGHAGALAMWSDGGWRFSPAFDGMSAWIATANLQAHRRGGVWMLGAETAATLSIGGVQVVGARQSSIVAPSGGVQVVGARQSSIVAPSGGSLIDTEARAGITAIILALRAHGLIAP